MVLFLGWASYLKKLPGEVEAFNEKSQEVVEELRL
jgi:hypothetical protein